jgi:pilus assembly protein CpaC
MRASPPCLTALCTPVASGALLLLAAGMPDAASAAPPQGAAATPLVVAATATSKLATQPAAMRSPAPALPATAPCARVDIAPAVQVSVGKSTMLRPTSPITRVLLGNPSGSRAARPSEAKEGARKDLADIVAPDDERARPGAGDIEVLLLSPTEVYLLGKRLGSTNVVLLDREGRCTAFDVVVGMDTAGLQTVIGQLLPEERNVRVAAAFDSVVLMGSVSDSGSVTRLMDLANAYVRGSGGGAAGSITGANPRIVNMLSTGAPQQVMLEVRVAEISKSLLDQFGINFARAYISNDGSALRWLSGILGGGIGHMGQVGNTVAGVPFSSVDAVVGGSVTGATGNGTTTGGITGGNVTSQVDLNGRTTFTTTYGTVPGRNVTNVTTNMQKTDGIVKVLAEPNVMAISGQEGRFNAGGKIFIPVAHEGVGGGVRVSLEEKEFGVSVRFRPTVLDAGRINLELVTEVSELNREGVGIGAPGISGLAVLPSFTSRKASTTVQLIDGQSFAIGGLIKNNTTTNIKAFPLLGELPVIGALFRSTEFQSDKSELVFVVTPRLVKPLPPGYALPTDNYIPPSRTDLQVHGRLEGRRTDNGDAAAASPAALPASAPSGGFQVK